MPKFRLARWWSLLKSAVVRWYEHDGFLLSAAMAYYASLSLFPLCLVLIAGLGFLTRISPHLQIQQQQLLATVSSNASPWLASQLKVMLAGITERAGVGGPIGLVSLLLAAIGIFIQFENLFDRIWEIDKPRKKGIWSAIRTALWDRAVAFVMLLGVGGLVVFVFLLNLALSALRPYVLQWALGHSLWQAGQPLLSLAMNCALFTLVYKSLPRVPVPWCAAATGGLLTAVTWQIGLRILELFVISDHYSAYGVVGSLLAVMLWMYYASAVVFLGGELARSVSLDGQKAS